MKFEKFYKEKCIIQLKNLADIRFGYYTQPIEKGSVQYLQARQFDDMGNIVSLSESFIDKDNKSMEHLLSDGDILLAGKGFRNFAWRYDEEIGPAVASSIFFVISPDRNMVDADYLAALLNTRNSQLYFQQLGAGTNINSIRKNELGAFGVPVLPMDIQQKIARIDKLHKQETALLKKYLQLTNDRFDAALKHLIKE